MTLSDFGILTDTRVRVESSTWQVRSHLPSSKHLQPCAAATPHTDHYLATNVEASCLDPYVAYSQFRRYAWGQYQLGTIDS